MLPGARAKINFPFNKFYPDVYVVREVLLSDDGQQVIGFEDLEINFDPKFLEEVEDVN